MNFFEHSLTLSVEIFSNTEVFVLFFFPLLHFFDFLHSNFIDSKEVIDIAIGVLSTFVVFGLKTLDELDMQFGAFFEAIVVEVPIVDDSEVNPSFFKFDNEILSVLLDSFLEVGKELGSIFAEVDVDPFRLRLQNSVFVNQYKSHNLYTLIILLYSNFIFIFFLLPFSPVFLHTEPN